MIPSHDPSDLCLSNVSDPMTFVWPLLIKNHVDVKDMSGLGIKWISLSFFRSPEALFFSFLFVVVFYYFLLFNFVQAYMYFYQWNKISNHIVLNLNCGFHYLLMLKTIVSHPAMNKCTIHDHFISVYIKTMKPFIFKPNLSIILSCTQTKHHKTHDFFQSHCSVDNHTSFGPIKVVCSAATCT